MNYCINYSQNFNYYDWFIVREVNVKYEENIFDLIKETKELKNKKIVLCLLDIKDVYSFFENKEDALVREAKGKIKVRFPKEILEDEGIIQKIKEIIGYDFFIDMYANSWAIFRGLLELNVSDVYIVEDLCFELMEVAAIAHSCGAKIRVFANVAQSSWEYEEPMKKFFIRPEDVKICNNCVDVIEFWESGNRLNTLFEIYAIKKEWKENLQYLISGFSEEIDGNQLPQDYIIPKLSCGKKCLKGRPCHNCETTQEIIEMLKEIDAGFNYADI